MLKKILNIKILIILIISTNLIGAFRQDYDLTIVGSLNFSGSISRLPIYIMDMLKENNLKINFIPTSQCSLDDTSHYVKKIFYDKNKTPGKVALLTDILHYYAGNPHLKVPHYSKIKIAYSMLESSRIPPAWTKILNDKFDAVVVPDEFLIEVYQNSGVKIPIFVLPIPLILEELLNKPEKQQVNKPFVFGCSAVNWDRKNIHHLIQSFSGVYRNSKDVVLKIHTRIYRQDNDLKGLIRNLRITNVELIEKNLSWNEYVKFLESLDCYVLLSKGEGFSITPREALALGIPCILSNNTGQKTICDSGFVYPVESRKEEPAFYDVFGLYCGNQFNCEIKDAMNALTYVYENYQEMLDKAKLGRIWVKQYLLNNLKNKYLNLIKPKKLILGDQNLITDDFLMTNSEKLYNKYLTL